MYPTLRTRGQISSGYLDDSFLFGDTPGPCKSNINDTFTLFGDLGFDVSREKSITQPSLVIEHPGSVLNSIDMTVSLPNEKIDTIIRLGSDNLKSQSCSIREAAKLIGTLVSCSPGVEYGPLLTNSLKMKKKNAALKITEGLLKLKCSFQS